MEEKRDLFDEWRKVRWTIDPRIVWYRRLSAVAAGVGIGLLVTGASFPVGKSLLVVAAALLALYWVTLGSGSTFVE